ncbi:MAG TPA: DUF2007 domain-containing protein [Ignavibacteria bacterium]|nr:hypothetical protein [Bacteroidota bacterium]HRI84901.1 DUF2007 domain-containing protein [Ignavibacteria bacterium]HRJ99466.1 DUF2007 domain-containing protein [Ignavibacteria bacterium]HRK00054.1 DUF2007 domain-containing protein [Ignavibacteria bacterium]
MDKAQQEKENHERLVTVYETGNEAVVAVIKSVLDEAGIRYLAKGEGVQDLFGVGVLGTGFNPITGPVQFRVMPEDEEYARALLKDIEG